MWWLSATVIPIVAAWFCIQQPPGSPLWFAAFGLFLLAALCRARATQLERNATRTLRDPERRFHHADVTGSADAEERAQKMPEVRASFEDLGFHRLGFFEWRSSSQELKGDVWEILASPSAKAFLELQRFRGRPVPSLRTVLDDGAIVETRIKPPRSFLSGLTWMSQDHPRAGFFYEAVKQATPAELFERHEARVQEVAEGRGVSPIAHDSMEVHARLVDRAMRVHRFRKTVTLALMLTCFPIAAVLAVLFVRGMLAGKDLDTPLTGPETLLLWLARLGCPLLANAGPWVGPWIARRLPFPVRPLVASPALGSAPLAATV